MDLNNNRTDENGKSGGNVNVLKEIGSFFLYVIIILGLTFLIVHYVGQRTVVSGHSMETTLQDGDNLIIDKITYRFHDPRRFDIVVFPPMGDDETYYIKRVIGLPGETIEIDDLGQIYINGEILKEGYGREVIQDKGVWDYPITLGDDEFFVMGDNRNGSEDSRFADVGAVKRDYILGRAWVRIYPFDNFTVLNHDYNNVNFFSQEEREEASMSSNYYLDDSEVWDDEDDYEDEDYEDEEDEEDDTETEDDGE